MADTTNDGGMAFPRAATEFGGSVWSPADGMSLRDYFAAWVMHSELVTAGALPAPAKALRDSARMAGQTVTERVAFLSYEMAEAMIAERVRRYGPAPTQAELDAADEALQF
jgi:hypothetical protein